MDENKYTNSFKHLFKQTYNEYVIYGIGDDCAILKPFKNIITTDILIENQHFVLEFSSASDIAMRAFYQNFADIAAMGAKPVACVIALGIPKKLLKTDFIKEFSQSICDICIQEKIAVIGGDLSLSEKVTVSITAFGDLENRKPIYRHNAHADEYLAVSGKTIGYSAKGYDSLIKYGGNTVRKSYQSENDKYISKYLFPKIDLSEGIKASDHQATSMIDLSDGLVVDAKRIAEASEIDIELFDSKNRAMPGISAEQYFFGGEDHLLLATFPNRNNIPKNWLVVGKTYQNTDGIYKVYGHELSNLDNKSWDHFDNAHKSLYS